MKIIILFCLSLVVTGCANRELKAPCGPISSYAENDECGELKPVNTALEDLAAG